MFFEFINYDKEFVFIFNWYNIHKSNSKLLFVGSTNKKMKKKIHAGPTPLDSHLNISDRSLQLNCSR